MPLLRGKFTMAIIKNIGELKTILNAGQTLQKMNDTGVSIVSNPSQNDGDSWARFERILNGINDLLDNAIKFKNANGSPTIIEARATHVSQSPPDYSSARTLGKGAKNAQNANDEGTQKVMKQVVDFLSNHINECVKENPNMTIGEAIAKLPINVTQLSVLLELYRKKQGG